MTLQKDSPIDLSSFVTIGDSVTAGYINGALTHFGQASSFASLLAKQLSLIKPIEFNIPFVDPESTGVGFTGNSEIILNEFKDDQKKKFARLDYLQAQGDFSIFEENLYSKCGPFQNLGVPAAKILFIDKPGYGSPINGEGNFNPFYKRMASDYTTSSILEDALKLNPTFFTFFVGNNDTMAYAFTGGTSDFITPAYSNDENNFSHCYSNCISALVKNGAKGVLANMASIYNVPYFTTLPYNGLLVNEKNHQMLSRIYQKSEIKFEMGLNPFICLDKNEKGEFCRQVNTDDMILLDLLLDQSREDYLKGILPIPTHYILPKEKIDKIESSIKKYNEIIYSLAQIHHLALVDIETLIKRVKIDRVYNPINQSLRFVNRGIFSLDGLHLNPLGHALLANSFIKVINLKYRSKIEYVDISKFKRTKRLGL